MGLKIIGRVGTNFLKLFFFLLKLYNFKHFERHGGRGGGGNLWVILVQVCSPVFLNLPQSYIWSSKKMTYSYT